MIRYDTDIVRYDVIGDSSWCVFIQYLADMQMNKVILLRGDEGPEVPADDAMPLWSVHQIELFLDRRRNVLQKTNTHTHPHTHRYKARRQPTESAGFTTPTTRFGITRKTYSSCSQKTLEKKKPLNCSQKTLEKKTPLNMLRTRGTDCR